MTIRKLLFLSSFLVIPITLWLLAAQPALVRRAAAIQGQQHADQEQAKNQSFIRQRDELKALWEEFEPQGEAALSNLESEVNRLRIPRILYALAKSQNLSDTRVNPESSTDSPASEFRLLMKGSMRDLVVYLDQLERSRQRVRFEELTLTFEPRANRGSVRKASLTALFAVPSIPLRAESKTAEKPSQEGK